VSAADILPPAAEPLQRRLVTPEGVDLRIVLGSASQRAGAFMIDAAIVVGVLILLSIVCAIAIGSGAKLQPAVFTVIWLVGFFLLRNGWWLIFELGPRAATPGKRVFGLRVAARDGGRLSADAIFARNAMREIEVFLPLTFLFVSGRGVDAWIALLGLAWSGIFALFPLFNRDRLRVGDLVAGTWVVRRPQRRLVADLTEARPAQVQSIRFTPAQLDAYGAKELQVLENVLRQNNRAVQTAVAERIRRKIDWPRREGETDWMFLDAYYAALRGHLESKLLLGRRRRDKHDKG
jgi:uncharacterized RDD family membrane protein YckC